MTKSMLRFMLAAVAISPVAALSQATPAAPAAATGTVLENAVEARFQLDLKVPDAALKAFLPEGFTSNVATQGPAKDCNLRLIFIDRTAVHGPDGKPIGKGSTRLAWLAAPVKDPAGATSQMIIGGITEDAADAPGPFGNFLAASVHEVKRTTTVGASGAIVDTQDWVLEAKTGEHLEMHIQYERLAAARGRATDAKFYSAKTPAYYQVSHQEQVLEILKNTTTNPPDHVKSFDLKLSGGSYAKLFDGTQQTLSWDNIVWIGRTVSIP